jgi:hypothetical protein
LTGGLITGLVVMHEAALLALLRRKWQGLGLERRKQQSPTATHIWSSLAGGE